MPKYFYFKHNIVTKPVYRFPTSKLTTNSVGQLFHIATKEWAGHVIVAVPKRWKRISAEEAKKQIK